MLSVNKSLNRQLKIGTISIRFVTIAILAIAALFYLAQTAQSATKNYHLRELEEEQSKLREENDRLEAEAIRLKSLAEIKKAAEQAKMTP